MQISGTNVGLLSPLTDAQTGQDIAGQSAQGAIDTSSASRLKINKSADIPADAGSLDTVAISSGSGLAASGRAPTPVYAEIWKGAVKLAEVDVHGHITSFSGMLTVGGGGGGPVAAARRAVQVAQQMGGEVRVAGSPVNNQTFLTRARLESAYRI